MHYNSNKFLSQKILLQRGASAHKRLRAFRRYIQTGKTHCTLLYNTKENPSFERENPICSYDVCVVVAVVVVDVSDGVRVAAIPRIHK